MTYDEALDLVLLIAGEWAGEYGFGMPAYATQVFKAVEIVEAARLTA